VQTLDERHKRRWEKSQMKEITVLLVTEGAASGRVIEESSVGVKVVVEVVVEVGWWFGRKVNAPVTGAGARADLTSSSLA
jgi:hypothetical protein